VAVALASVTPADGAEKIPRDFPVTAEITDTTDIDPSKVEVVVNGISHTLANGRLENWNVAAISGGSYVSDLTDVYFGTRREWWDAQVAGVEAVTVTVKYDGGISEGGPVSIAAALASGADASMASANILAELFQLYVGSWRDIHCLVSEVAQGVAADIRAWVGHRYFDYIEGGGIVAILEITISEGSGVIEGYRLEYHEGGAILQGYRRDPRARPRWRRARGPERSQYP
jgi:hypothetical protein